MRKCYHNADEIAKIIPISYNNTIKALALFLENFSSVKLCFCRFIKGL